MAPEPGQILSLLSHELRSPLGVVRGYLRLLDQHQGELSPNHRLAVTAALKASERCVDLLAQASALAQLWRADSPVKGHPLALGDLLAPLAHTVKGPDAQVLPVEIGHVTEATLSGDRSLLQTALSSLVMAVHRAQPEAVTVDVSSHVQEGAERAGVSVLIAPRGSTPDDGADTPLDLRRGGLGLDLPMALAIVEAHRGSIRERRGADGRISVIVWLPGHGT